MNNILPGEGWPEVVSRLEREQGLVLMLGNVDTGKTTLVRYLIAQLLERGLAVALVDADIGQSSLCLPGAVGMKIFHTDNDINYFTCEHLSFIGTTNPAKSLFQLIAATKMLADIAQRGADVVIIDTTGLVTGEIGIRLKLSKIKTLKPSTVIAIQQEGECEPILSRLHDTQILRLMPSPKVRRRAQDARGRYRKEKLAAWFLSQPLHEYRVTAEKAAIYRFGRQVTLSDNDLRIGSIIGLNHGISTITLGIITEIESRCLTLQAPPVSLKGVNRIVYGDLAFEP